MSQQGSTALMKLAAIESARAALRATPESAVAAALLNSESALAASVLDLARAFDAVHPEVATRRTLCAVIAQLEHPERLDKDARELYDAKERTFREWKKKVKAVVEAAEQGALQLGQDLLMDASTEQQARMEPQADVIDNPDGSPPVSIAPSPPWSMEPSDASSMASSVSLHSAYGSWASDTAQLVATPQHSTTGHAAGAVVFRRSSTDIEYLMCSHNLASPCSWTPPKGNLNRSDTDVFQAAMCKTIDATGIREEALNFHPFTYDPIKVSYNLPKPTAQVPSGVKITTYFIAELVDGEAAPHPSPPSKKIRGTRKDAWFFNRFQWMSLRHAKDCSDVFVAMHKLLDLAEGCIITSLVPPTVLAGRNTDDATKVTKADEVAALTTTMALARLANEEANDVEPGTNSWWSEA